MTLQQLTALRTSDSRPRTPFHRVPVHVGGSLLHAWLERTIDKNNTSERKTLVFPKPGRLLPHLPRHVQDSWQGYEREIQSLSEDWHLRRIPAFKRVERLIHDGHILTSYDTTTVAYRFGAVPALLIGHVDGYQAALLHEGAAQELARMPSSEEEWVERLCSLERYFPFLMTAYFEQIGYYLRALFSGATDGHVMALCLRVREIVMQSIRTKLRDIEDCPPSYGTAHAVALRIAASHRRDIAAAHAVDEFAHLLVNYIYRFFCIGDRAPEYHDRLMQRPASKTLFEEDEVSFLQRCALNIADPHDTFLETLQNQQGRLPPWLFTLGAASAFVAEVARFTRGRDPCTPTIFVTYHFRVKVTNQFVQVVEDALRARSRRAHIVQGRPLPENIRSSLLARVWFADHQLLVLPPTWEREEGGTKVLRPRGNWVMMELLYGRLIERGLTVVAAEPVSEDLVEGFQQHIREYTDDLEIPQIAEEGWPHFVVGAKRALSDDIHSRRYLRWSPDPQALAAFVDDFATSVVDPAAVRLLGTLFHSWSYFFHWRTWSVVQAILQIELDGKNTMSVKDVASFIWKRRQSDDRFAWAFQNYKSSTLEPFVSKCLREDLVTFSFQVAGSALYPIKAYKKGTPWVIEPRFWPTYSTICDALQISRPAEHTKAILQQLMAHRSE